MYTSNQRKPRTVVIIYWAKNNEVEEEREKNTVGILEWRSLRRRESATGCKDGFSCWGESDANTTDSSNITPPTTTPISLSLSVSVCVCVCVLVLLQRKRNEKTKGKGNAKEGINRRLLPQQACVQCLSIIYICWSLKLLIWDFKNFSLNSPPQRYKFTRTQTFSMMKTKIMIFNGLGNNTGF